MPRLFTGLELPEAVADELALVRGGDCRARAGSSPRITTFRFNHRRLDGIAAALREGQLPGPPF